MYEFEDVDSKNHTSFCQFSREMAENCLEVEGGPKCAGYSTRKPEMDFNLFLIKTRTITNGSIEIFELHNLQMPLIRLFVFVIHSW